MTQQDKPIEQRTKAALEQVVGKTVIRQGGRMAIIEVEDVILPPSEIEGNAAKLVSQVEGSSQDRDNADLGAATIQSQPFNIGGNFGR